MCISDGIVIWTVCAKNQLYEMVGWLKLCNLLAFKQLDLKQIVSTYIQHIHFSLTVLWDFYSISFLDNQSLSKMQETFLFRLKRKNQTNKQPNQKTTNQTKKNNRTTNFLSQ